MCGIAGLIAKNGAPALESHVQLMLQGLVHRGPDAGGLWSRKGVVFGHRRLKIIDLSDEANQPFVEGGSSLVFNGEIFNYLEIRNVLKNQVHFKTKSDTEVLFHALQVWGQGALEKIEGQFAFCFYDHGRHQVLLARDPVGICPLYTMEDETAVYFSSEIRPLVSLRKSALDARAVADYFTFRYNIQNGRTLFQNVRRFSPAHVSVFSLPSGARRDRRYWEMQFDPCVRPHAVVQREFNDLMRREVKTQAMADVPVGLYLSGGIDSGALLTSYKENGNDIRSFTLDFARDGVDRQFVDKLWPGESPHKEIIPFSEGDYSVLPQAVEAMEEPFGDFIVCANYRLAQRAAQSVKVVLSGEGGDEVFCGYDHQRAYLSMNRWHNVVSAAFLGRMLKWIPSRVLAHASTYPGHFGVREKNHVAGVLNAMENPSEAYRRLVTLFSPEDLGRLFSPRYQSHFEIRPDTAPLSAIFEGNRPLWQSIIKAEVEQLTLIVNLLKQDRFAMRFSMEGRVPFASRAMLSFISRLPQEEILSRRNKRLLLDYSGRNDICKRPLAILSDAMALHALSTAWDRWVTRGAVEIHGFFSWKELENLRADMYRGSLLGVKKAMTVIVFMLWINTFSPYLENSHG